METQGTEKGRASRAAFPFQRIGECMELKRAGDGPNMASRRGLEAVEARGWLRCETRQKKGKQEELSAVYLPRARRVGDMRAQPRHSVRMVMEQWAATGERERETRMTEDEANDFFFFSLHASAPQRTVAASTSPKYLTECDGQG